MNTLIEPADCSGALKSRRGEQGGGARGTIAFQKSEERNFFIIQPIQSRTCSALQSCFQRHPTTTNHIKVNRILIIHSNNCAV